MMKYNTNPIVKKITIGFGGVQDRMLHIDILVSRRPYCIEYAGSHSNSIAKRCKARSVLGWGTARELHGVDGYLSMRPKTR